MKKLGIDTQSTTNTGASVKVRLKYVIQIEGHVSGATFYFYRERHFGSF